MASAVCSSCSQSAVHRARATERELRILIVDDDEHFRGAVEQVLRELGHACWTARGGAEALEMHRRKRFDVVLSDWMMPEMDGLELCRRIRVAGSDAYTYFIFMTGLAERSSLVEALREGADEYITKPLDIDQLRARLVSAARITTFNRALLEKNASLRRGSERSFKAARIDPLTNVGNRLRLQEDLDALVARASRYGHRYCVAICDVDWFKHYNDYFGHPAGDEALRRVVRAIAESVRRGDTVYRYGGEEFVVIIAEQSLAHAAAVMERVRECVERLAISQSPLMPGRVGESLSGSVVTISVGIAEFRHAEDSPLGEEWLQRADKALYRAKANGRNRVESAVDVSLACHSDDARRRRNSEV